MSKRYLIWKDPACNGRDIEWMELTGKEFLTLMRQAENKSRHFVRLGSEVFDEEVLVVEATWEQYLEWRKDYDRHRYLTDGQHGHEEVSLDQPTAHDENTSLHDLIADHAAEVEREVTESLSLDRLRFCMGQFSETERKILLDFYSKRKTLAELARELDISHQAVSKRISSLISRLQKFF